MSTMMMNSKLFGNYLTRTFAEIFPTADTFMSEYAVSPLSNTDVVDVSVIYYLLYANYGNSPISNMDENQFKYRVWSTIFMYGPSWQKRLDVQKKLRGLTESDILKGGRAVYNHAYNDGGAPSSDTAEPLNYINDQNTTNYQKSKMEGYSILLSLLETDVTKEFIDKFRPMFSKFVTPGYPLWYKDESEELV